MPIDQKRINGPEVTVPYEIYVERDSSEIQKVVKFERERDKNGRRLNELRKMFVKTGIVSQAKGSAYIEMGRTKVVCSVFDPREIPNKSSYRVQGELYCEFKFAPFSSYKRRIHQQNAEEKEYSVIMQRALEPAVCRHEFPNFQVDIYALVLDNGGSSLAAAIMAASLALANASVPMFGLVTAVTVGINRDSLFLDPTDEEESYCNSAFAEPGDQGEQGDHGVLVQSSLPQLDQVSEFFLVGSVGMSGICRAVDLINCANGEITPVLQQCLVRSVARHLRKLELEGGTAT